jgi:hypothetical protein
MAYKEVAPSGYQLNRSGEVIPNRMKTHLAPIGWKYLESGKMVRTNQFAQDISTQPRFSSNLGDMHRGLARSLFASPVEQVVNSRHLGDWYEDEIETITADSLGAGEVDNVLVWANLRDTYSMQGKVVRMIPKGSVGIIYNEYFNPDTTDKWFGVMFKAEDNQGRSLNPLAIKDDVYGFIRSDKFTVSKPTTRKENITNYQQKLDAKTPKEIQRLKGQAGGSIPTQPAPTPPPTPPMAEKATSLPLWAKIGMAGAAGLVAYNLTQPKRPRLRVRR